MNYNLRQLFVTTALIAVLCLPLGRFIRLLEMKAVLNSILAIPWLLNINVKFYNLNYNDGWIALSAILGGIITFFLIIFLISIIWIIFDLAYKWANPNKNIIDYQI